MKTYKLLGEDAHISAARLRVPLFIDCLDFHVQAPVYPY